MSVKVYIGLGSNLSDPLEQLNLAVATLNKHQAISNLKVSSFYKSKPMGPQDQPDYINAVAAFDTELMPEQLLDELQKIEQCQGRIRDKRWGARTLDLDILLFGDETINTARLTIPHYGLRERNFVLYPLAEIVTDDFLIPQLGEIKKLIQNCSITGLERLDVKND